MSAPDARNVPADPASTERLAAAGLDYRVVDLAEDEQASAFLNAVDRGFLETVPNVEALAQARRIFSARRNIGVFDSRSTEDALPVGTINSWVTPLTVPGGGEVDMWAISMVTVAAKHRRRGIARALLEGELRAAASAGVPFAGLTVTEATIYGRYGFGAAIPVTHLTVDTRRAGWGGQNPSGRVEYVDRDTLATDMGVVHERARRGVPGRIPGWRGRWEEHAGASPAVKARDAVRGVHYLDETGEVRGALAYTLAERGGTARFALTVRLLVAETPDAAAALWGFALQHDLVDEVTAALRPIDDPVPWLVHDPRAVTQVVHDHGWLRILDVPGALTSRCYSAPIDVPIRVEDLLGFAAGTWRLQADQAGTATVTPVTADEVTETTPEATLDISTLSALYVGGVRAATLHGAGRIEADAATIELLDRAFASYPVPSLDIWY